MVERDEYAAIRDRIIGLSHLHGLRCDWAETTQRQRFLLLWDAEGRVAARAIVPLYPRETPRLVDSLEQGLAHLFGDDWLED
ncbi:hypothetical protein ETD86_06385 [Nonomuraea turkmeniaca]|uniref:Uncharacterized protein n=1 Tax=Nonomuraea turkmeniaca TaxID=103838 RepID=A0A5S4FV23_9ACTN|nr:hypothetical protein [Nonomuraea turkmeniaca]TMR23951.1 hypothetical protein ETD86_06385 [Nonomuraea turkmeniaca]